jgi:hypothetical protein
MVLCIFPAYSYADASGTSPAKIVTGAYVNQIYAVNLKENKFSVDLYVWFRYADNAKNPLDTMEIINGRIESKTIITKKKINGINYVSCRIIATINKFWDVSKFPLDKHTIEIEIEDSDLDETKSIYVADTDNAGINPDAQVRGWTIARVQSSVKSKLYNTNYGDASLPVSNQSSYSRYILSIDVVRPGYGQFFRLFALMFLAAFVSLLAFLLQPHAGPRFGLGTGALFAAAANAFVVGASLPESNAFTLADQLQLMTNVLIFLTLLISTLSLRAFNKGKEEVALKIDLISLSLCHPYIFLELCLWYSQQNNS